MQLVDTHCHLQGKFFDSTELVQFDRQAILERAKIAGVAKIICVGTDELESKKAVEFAKANANVWASVALHPHDQPVGIGDLSELEQLLASSKVVAIGECGLDYFYLDVDKSVQKQRLIFQLELGRKYGLPFIFHVREAFDDFWQIIDDFNAMTDTKSEKVRGVIHCFSADSEILAQALDRGMYIGLNGIMTFTKDPAQLEAAKKVPLDRLLLETDSPFLTPKPFRGTINEPKQILPIAVFLSDLRSENLDKLAEATTHNANKLFGI
jgi:TatD DNase family protein